MDKEDALSKKVIYDIFILQIIAYFYFSKIIIDVKKYIFIFDITYFDVHIFPMKFRCQS